jgi:hypothetical protein
VCRLMSVVYSSKASMLQPMTEKKSAARLMYAKSRGVKVSTGWPCQINLSPDFEWQPRAEYSALQSGVVLGPLGFGAECFELEFEGIRVVSTAFRFAKS